MITNIKSIFRRGRKAGFITNLRGRPKKISTSMTDPILTLLSSILDRKTLKINRQILKATHHTENNSKIKHLRNFYVFQMKEKLK